ncbi:hypothetical protein [Streptomyces sp. PU-14G]|uniref:hypothetical protein n=1 Tax=Streptomyces sp. PU-14G TaxID=2800808 RepID=UPI0034DE7B17
MTLSPLIREILQDGEDDWVAIDNVIAYAWRHAESSGTDPEAMTVELLTALLKGNLMEIGTLEEAGFSPWCMPVADTVRTCVAAFDTYHWEPRGTLYWLSITESGRSWLNEHP